jgi:hypothetical protein
MRIHDLESFLRLKKNMEGTSVKPGETAEIPLNEKS